jgi:hypothetical protein
MQRHVAGHVAALVAAIAAVSSVAAVRTIALANYLEAVSHFVAGARNIHAFLHDCCLEKL